MKVKFKPHSRFPGVYLVDLREKRLVLATKNLHPTKAVYGERLVEIDEFEFRLWDPYKSKLAASILRGLSEIPIKPGHKVLYLGAASGTTVSHVSDIVGIEGKVYCVEFSFRPLRDLINNVSSFRRNVIPILADARFPERYRILVEEVDEVYCDIAQPEQAKVLANNAVLFLRDRGWALLSIKARSINSTLDPSLIFKREINVLKRRGFDVKEMVHLRPFDKAHAMILARSK